MLKMQISLKVQLKILDKIKPFYELSKYAIDHPTNMLLNEYGNYISKISKNFNKIDNHNLRKILWKELEKKMQGIPEQLYELFEDMMENVISMDIDDFNILIRYSLLNERSNFHITDDQLKLLDFSEELIRIKDFCNDSQYIIEKYGVFTKKRTLE